jgi:hypothetical protein
LTTLSPDKWHNDKAAAADCQAEVEKLTGLTAILSVTAYLSQVDASRLSRGGKPKQPLQLTLPVAMPPSQSGILSRLWRFLLLAGSGLTTDLALDPKSRFNNSCEKSTRKPALGTVLALLLRRSRGQLPKNLRIPQPDAQCIPQRGKA